MAAPTVVADTATTHQAVSKVVDVLANDTTTGATTIAFKASGQPSGVVLSNSNRTATVTGEGVYTIPTTGDNAYKVVFTPDEDFSGTGKALIVVVTDTEGTGEATCTITVTAATDLASATRIQGVATTGQRLVTVVLDEEITAGESINADDIGLNNISATNVVVAQSNTSTKFPAYATTLASGSVVTFIGN